MGAGEEDPDPPLPAPGAAGGSGEDAGVGSGPRDVATAPGDERKGRLRPKLTPVTREESDSDEAGLGFHDVVPRPSRATGESKKKKGKKKNRPKLRLVPSGSSCADDDGGGSHETEKNARPRGAPEDGLGSHDSAPLPSSHDAKKKKIRPKLYPMPPDSDCVNEEDGCSHDKNGNLRLKVTPMPLEESDSDDAGLGFHGIVPSKSLSHAKKKKKKIRPKISPVPSKSNRVNEEEDGKENKMERLRPKLAPITPEESDSDEAGLGFHDIVPSPCLAQGDAKKKIRPKLSPEPSSSTFVEEKKEDNGNNNSFGFDETATFPISKSKKSCPKLIPTARAGVGAASKKKARRKVAPTHLSESSEEDEDGIDLVFNNAESTPAIVDEEGSDSGLDDIAPPPISKVNKSRQKPTALRASWPGPTKKMRRKLTPVSSSEFAAEEDDDTGLGFHDIVSSPAHGGGGADVVFDDVAPLPISKDNKSCPEFTRSSPEADRKTDAKEKARRRLTPMLSPGDVEEEEGDTDLGFDDVVSTPASREITPAVIKPEEDVKEEDEDRVEAGQSGHMVTAIENNPGAFYPVQSYCLHPGLVRTNVV